MTRKTKSKICDTPINKLTDEQINDDLERAAKTGSMILALTKGLTDCPACSELALIMALASMMHYNETKPEDLVPLLNNLIEQTSLMKTVFVGTTLTAIPVSLDVEKPDPSQVH